MRLRDRRPRFGLVWERKEIEHEKAVNEDFVAPTYVGWLKNIWNDTLRKLERNNRQKLGQQKNNIPSINLEKKIVTPSEKIKHNTTLKSLTGDEEVVKALLIDRLVNELHYKPENLETEKEYTIKGGHSKINPRIDVLVKDEQGNPFFFIEVKAPNKFEADKTEIEGQLFALAQTEERDFKTKVRYLVYYTAEMPEDD